MSTQDWIYVDVPARLTSGEIWVAVDVHIKCVATGEIRVYRSHEQLCTENGYPDVFNWMDGNYSCDCNRALFFAQCVEGTDPSDDMPCTNHKFKVRLINPATGWCYCSEFKPE